ncbi:hypothetical protein CYMTET_35799 [Cymbomonas tetramitiformis]|uniref:Uncharacterized protein n=1 Tax=Cymbomonas tetramitiformis TaxID=36881 RepID=A0AAE0F8H9_9CHLO|nr:hypothetical protein CYMTET_35799 [Cymbomonas tetramitiformis]
MNNDAEREASRDDSNEGETDHVKDEVPAPPQAETPCAKAEPHTGVELPTDNLWNFRKMYSAEGEFLNPCDALGECVWTPPMFDATSVTFRDLLASWQEEWGRIDLSTHGVSLTPLAEFKTATEAIGAEVPLVTKLAHHWAMIFRDDSNVIDLVRSVSVGAGWAFEHKVDKLHDEKVSHRRVVPIPEHIAAAIHGVGVVDKDHSNFEKVRVVHNYSENEDASVKSAPDIPKQKWQFVSDALGLLRAGYHMIKVGIKGAYRHLPFALEYLPYHTYRWGELAADLRFPFGHRAVPGKFHEVTAALVRFMRAQGFSATVGFRDDYWVCTGTATCPRGALEALRLLQDVLEFLGLEMAWEKCEGPVQDIIFLGVRLCTNEFREGRVSASLPVHKCERLRDTALRLAHGGWCTRNVLRG